MACKSYDIYNAARRPRKAVARLMYDERDGSLEIQIADNAEPRDLPLMLALFAERGETAIPDKWARKWVEERIPPQSRQNLGEILRANDLEAYDAMALLFASEGRSAQDDFLIRETPVSSTTYAVVSLDDADADERTQEHSSSNKWCEAIGPRIAKRRKALGMTQRELAEKTGIDQAAISRIEAGRANPTLDTLDALAEGVEASLLVKLL